MEAKVGVSPELLSAFRSANEACIRYERGADPRHLDEAASILERIIDEPRFRVVEPNSCIGFHLRKRHGRRLIALR